MNPIEVAPKAIYLSFLLALVAIIIGSYILIFLSIICIVLVFWYCRGSTTIADKPSREDEIVMPCDGVVSNVYCDIQRMTHIDISHEWSHRHGVYMMFNGTMVDVATNDLSTTFIIASDIGRIEMAVKATTPHLLPRTFVKSGDHVQKGELISFIPFEATIHIVLPVYQSSIILSRLQHKHAGDVIGSVEQVWSL